MLQSVFLCISEVLLWYVKFFVKMFQQNKLEQLEKPILLIFDNQGTQMPYKTINEAIYYKIIILRLRQAQVMPNNLWTFQLSPLWSIPGEKFCKHSMQIAAFTKYRKLLRLRRVIISLKVLKDRIFTTLKIVLLNTRSTWYILLWLPETKKNLSIYIYIYSQKHLYGINSCMFKIKFHILYTNNMIKFKLLLN